MTIAMIIFSFFLGGVFIYFTMRIHHNEIIQQMRADIVDALAKQAQDSFEAGYMRNEIERTARKKRMSRIDTQLIPAQR
jgi:Ca2+/H+ antiporter